MPIGCYNTSSSINVDDRRSSLRFMCRKEQFRVSVLKRVLVQCRRCASLFARAAHMMATRSVPTGISSPLPLVFKWALIAIYDRHFFIDEAEKKLVEHYQEQKALTRMQFHDSEDPFVDKMPKSARARVYVWRQEKIESERGRGEGLPLANVIILIFGISCRFASWLVKRFGAGVLCSGTGVVDVAGGKGFLSFEVLLSLSLSLYTYS